MLCVKDVILKMFLYTHVNEICNFACVYMEQNCLAIFQGSFFPCSPGESFFVISEKIKFKNYSEIKILQVLCGFFCLF